MLRLEEGCYGGDDTVGDDTVGGGMLRRGDATVGYSQQSSSSNFSIRAFRAGIERARICQFELFEPILSSKLDKQFPVERFEATVSRSSVPSPPLKTET